MMPDSRKVLRVYYDAAAPKYLKRASKGLMGWMRQRELALTHSMIPSCGNGRKALDAGCGPGYYAQVMKERGFDVTAVDISPRMVEIVSQLGLPAYVMDIEHSEPHPDLPAPFDFIFCAGVLEFAHDVRAFLSALRRLASDDAEMLLVAPGRGLFGFCYAEYLKSRGIPARVYKRKPLALDLEAAGFEPLEIRQSWPICLVTRAKAV